MFYSELILTKKGPLALIWLAAHWDQRLTKNQILQADITNKAEGIIEPPVALSLRTSGHLLLGVVKIYSRKVKYMLHEVDEAMSKLRLQNLANPKVDLGEKNLTANFSNITLPPTGTTSRGIIIPDRQKEDMLLDDDILMKRIGDLIKDGENTNMLDDWQLEGTLDSQLLSQSLLETPQLRGDAQKRTPGTDGSRIGGDVEFPLFSQTGEDAMREEINFPNLFGDQDGGDGLISGRPSDAQALEIGLGGDDFAEAPPPLDGIGDDGGDQIPDYRGEAMQLKKPQEKRRTGRKRYRPAQWDEEPTMDKDDYKALIRDTSSITRERSKIRRIQDTSHRHAFQEDRRKQMLEDMSNREVVNYLWFNTSPYALAPRLQQLQRNGMKHMRVGDQDDRRMIDEEDEEDDHLRQRRDDLDGLGGGGDDGGDELPPVPLDGEDLDQLDVETQDPRRLTMDGTLGMDDMDTLFDGSQMEGYLRDSGVEKDVFAPVTEDEIRERYELNEKLKSQNMEYSDQTVNYLAKLKAGFQSSGSDEVSFDNLLSGKMGRREAAQGFYQILELESKRMIDTKQNKPYGEIRVRQTRLFEQALMGDDE